MSPARIASLSPRQRECLRLTFHRKTSKEIAAELGLSAGTVNTYISEAIATLGARNRRHAAELLVEAEGAPPPEIVQLQSHGVIEQDDVLHPATGNDGAWRRSLPIRQKGALGNDLSILLRLAWPVGLAIFCAIGFGMLAIGIRIVSDALRFLFR